MKFKFTWAHGVITALICFILFICSMVFSNQFSNSYDLVTDEYYEEEINYQQEIDATKNAAKLKERPEINMDRTGILITFPKEFNLTNTKGRFLLFRANSKELDIKKNFLDLSPQNTILIPNKILVKGKYTLKLYWSKDKINYQMEVPIIWK
ncbi:FixH family protein [Apibacter adventoris]|uniref:FixH family protein n=1 Tax=Apibacter adventoris TaxID=1679466 RepID=UPI000CF6088F|nr:FixH family protein [Apibacter adventoris]PQL92562.1 nitrogen fixation protein FixH [Apibacter adventoris]